MTNVDAATSIQELRTELKSWEKTFAQAHHGRKPTREDIKLDATIADKYRQFNRITRPEQHTTPRKHANGRPPCREALTEQTTNTTATKALAAQDDDGEQVEPTPAHVRCALGPTPQKDGLVLGIFDLFNSATPSKGTAPQTSELEPALGGTPSKARFPSTSIAYSSRTPQSSSKRFYLDAFAGTPLKRKREDEEGTPASVKRQFATPSFLRRDSKFDTILEDHDDGDGLPALLSRKTGQRKGMARSFSSIIAGLRKNEDERMDEEWEILKELEAEADDSASQPKRVDAVAAVIVEDSQAVEMPLGPDQASVSDESEPDVNQASRKPWKKKGLKRQTKRVNMKPVLHAPQKAVVPESQIIDEDNAESDVVAESGDVSKKPEGLIRKTVRKVNEAAHMNFRRLKIKNKNSKANGRPGRFGRR